MAYNISSTYDFSTMLKQHQIDQVQIRQVNGDDGKPHKGGVALGKLKGRTFVLKEYDKKSAGLLKRVKHFFQAHKYRKQERLAARFIQTISPDNNKFTKIDFKPAHNLFLFVATPVKNLEESIERLTTKPDTIPANGDTIEKITSSEDDIYVTVNKSSDYEDNFHNVVKTLYPNNSSKIYNYTSSFYLENKPEQYRYKNILPPAHSHVAISNNPDINANRVNIGNIEAIATQAPKEGYAGDIFQLASQITPAEKRPVIIDLTTDNDKKSRKIPQYHNISKGSEQRFGNLSIKGQGVYNKKIKAQRGFPDNSHITIKSYKATDQERARSMNVVHYTGWPDKGVIELDNLIDLVTTINTACADGQAPVIHCTAGVGRTGTVISALALQDAFKEGRLTEENKMAMIASIIAKGKHDRGSEFVQTGSQYNLLIAYADHLLKS